MEPESPQEHPSDSRPDQTKDEPGQGPPQPRRWWERVRNPAICVLLVAGLGLFGWVANTHYPLHKWLFFMVAQYWLYAAFFSAACMATGWRAIKALLPEPPRLGEQLTLAFALGVLVFVLGIYLFGLIGLIGPVFFFVWPGLMLAFGARPAWRDLGPSATRGADVLELKQNLRVLGFLKGKTALTSKWDAATTKAVKAWQQRLHVPATGTLALGSVVFRPGPLRVGALAAAVGDLLAPGAPLYDTTAASQQVSAELKADLRHLARVGDPVSLLLPGGATATGRISAIGTIAHATPDGSGSTVTLSITLDDPSAAAAYAQATVSVEITTTVASDVLTVPVTALVATSGGGYAVEVVRGATTDFVRVQPGVFANGDVAYIVGPYEELLRVLRDDQGLQPAAVVELPHDESGAVPTVG